MNKVPEYKVAMDQLNLLEKIGQLFMPAAFINDSEEEIQNSKFNPRTSYRRTLFFS